MSQPISIENPAAPQPNLSAKQILPWLVAVAFFMESLDTTILNTAVPVIADALKVAPLSMKSVLSCYTLSLAVFIPISGWMADRFGTRRVFASAISLFTLGSLLCGTAGNIHLLVFFRILQGCGGAMMMPVGRITLVRTFPKSELIRAMSFVAIPGLLGPILGPIVGGVITQYSHWRMLFFVNIPVGLVGLYLVYRHLPDYRAEKSHPLDWPGLVLFGSGIALLSYVVEIFGEHALTPIQRYGLLALSIALIAGYLFRAARTEFPLLQLGLFRLRTFRAAVGGSFFTRLGIGGIPFLLPLLYQVGLGFTPVQSGLLVFPQALAAMALKFSMSKILKRLGYRRVLISNTVIIGILILFYATIGVRTPAWLIVAQAFIYGFFTSLQYTSMNTLGYADVSGPQTSGASTIVSTAQQMSVSFGVACASLTTAWFVPDRHHCSPPEMIQGLHKAFLVLGAMTIVSSIVFWTLKPNDGDSVSTHKGA